MITIADIAADVLKQKTIIDGLVTLINGLRAKIAQAAAGAPAQDVLNQLDADLQAQTNQLSLAVLAGTGVSAGTPTVDVTPVGTVPPDPITPANPAESIQTAPAPAVPPADAAPAPAAPSGPSGI